MSFIKPFFLISLFALSSCAEELTNQLKPVPVALGKINEIVVICDKDMWEGPVGDTLYYYFSAAYPILPQPEPLFNLRHYTPEQLVADPLRKELRTYLFAGNLKDGNSSTANMIKKDIGGEKVQKALNDRSYHTTIGKDKWADGQLLFYLFGYSEDELVEGIQTHFQAIRTRINKADEEKIEANIYMDGENRKLNEEVMETFGVEMRVPYDYVLALNEGGVVWMRKETQELSSNIFVRKLKYSDKSQFSKEYIKAVRDSLGRKHVSSEVPNTYMRINDVDLPMLTETTQINGNYALEARGIWEIVNDFMGGAFLSYLILNEESGELVFVDGFVYAPGKRKRDYLQQLEYVFSSVKF